MTRTRWIVISVLIVGAILAIVYGVISLVGAIDRIPIKTVPGDINSAQLIESDGVVVYQVKDLEGQTRNMSAQDFADQVYKERSEQSLGYKLMTKVLNVSSAATVGWVILGLFGQLLFASRMIVQWIVSEKERKSVVPTAFWWLALGGASMLIIYFIWRRDIVGILGQATGWLIYIRNLYFIYLKQPKLEAEDTAAAAAE